MRTSWRAIFAALLASAAVCGGANGADLAGAVEQKLANGLKVVVIPDHRSPVVTHVVAYNFGGADDPPGASGVAHFVEHLMYKGTATAPAGSFARTITNLGGRENAVTSRDTTIYHQRVPRDGLARVMAIEADRMVNLRFDDEEVRREREVIVEERRQRIDLSPLNLLNEQVTAALHVNHPYRNPVLGWPHEMSRLTRKQAETFYRRHYDAANAVVVVQGDVEPREVLQLAERAFGGIETRGIAPPSVRPRDPEPRAAHRIEMTDARVPSRAIYRATFVASDPRMPHLAETVEVLARILAQGQTSRLAMRLVERDKLAIVSEGGSERSRDGTGLAIYTVAAPGRDAGAIEAAIQDEIDKLATSGVEQDEVERAVSASMTADIYDGDNQQKSALHVAEALANGETLEFVRGRKDRLAAVTADDVRRVAAGYLGSMHWVTGILLPKPERTSAASGSGK